MDGRGMNIARPGGARHVGTGRLAVLGMVFLMLLGGCSERAYSQPAPLSRTGTGTAEVALPIQKPHPAGHGGEQIALAAETVVESQTGLASWYGKRFHGRRTASGSLFDMAELTAAHLSLPFGSRVRVTNLANGRSLVVVITDRGPYVKPRVIDLSRAAARKLGFLEDGLAKVRLDVLADTAG